MWFDSSQVVPIVSMFIDIEVYFLDVLKFLTGGMESIESDSGGLKMWNLFPFTVPSAFYFVSEFVPCSMFSGIFIYNKTDFLLFTRKGGFCYQ